MRMQEQREGGIVAPTRSQPRRYKGWVVSTTLCPLYRLERPGTYYTGDPWTSGPIWIRIRFLY